MMRRASMRKRANKDDDAFSKGDEQMTAVEDEPFAQLKATPGNAATAHTFLI